MAEWLMIVLIIVFIILTGLMCYGLNRVRNKITNQTQVIKEQSKNINRI